MEKEVKTMKPTSKYDKLMKKKKGLFTSDNRPIEVYKKGKEKIYIAFDREGTMEIISHNPLPLIASSLALKYGGDVVDYGVNKLLGKKKEPSEVSNKEMRPQRKSLRDQIIEREVYGDKDFSD